MLNFIQKNFIKINLNKNDFNEDGRGVAMTTITDICNGKADLDKCTAGTLHKIAKVLNVTVDAILENNSADNVDYRCSFETFKSNTCHHVMLMYGKEASNRKQEIDRQHYTIPNQRPKDKHCGKI